MREKDEGCLNILSDIAAHIGGITFLLLSVTVSAVILLRPETSPASHAELACVEHVTMYATEPCRCLPVDAYPKGSPLRGLPECETGGAE